MKDAQPHDVLDMTLPPELRDIVTYERVTAIQSQEKMEKPMPAETPATEVNEKAIAAVVDQILAARDSKLALATEIKTLTQAKADAEVKSAKAEAALATANTTIASLTKDAETAKASTTEKVTAAETAKAAAEKTTAELTKTVAGLTRKLADVEAEKTIATRTAAVKALGEKIATEDRINRAVARNEDGSFKTSDEAFTAWVADLKSVAEAVTPAGKTPAPAAATTPAPAAAAAPAVPAAPDLAGAAAAAQATQALANAGTPAATPTLHQAYVNAFPCE